MDTENALMAPEPAHRSVDAPATPVMVRDNGPFDGAWSHTLELIASPWRLHVSPALGEVLWMHEPGEQEPHAIRIPLSEAPEEVRLLAGPALAAGPPSQSSKRT